MGITYEPPMNIINPQLTDIPQTTNITDTNTTGVYVDAGLPTEPAQLFQTDIVAMDTTNSTAPTMESSIITN